MATFFTFPQGPLVSFGTFNFSSGGVLEPGWGVSVNPETISLVNNPNEADLAGFATMSMHGVYVWEYLVGRVTQTLKQAQDEITTLTTMLKTQNGDGTTGQVATLTVALAGYTGVNATATARLVGMTANQTAPTWAKLSLSFLCPAGFSYTA